MGLLYQHMVRGSARRRRPSDASMGVRRPEWSLSRRPESSSKERAGQRAVAPVSPVQDGGPIGIGAKMDPIQTPYAGATRHGVAGSIRECERPV